mgnify:CR=1 FL=1
MKRQNPKKEMKEKEKEEEFEELDIERIQEGMKVAKDVYNNYGTLIIRKNREIQGKHISQFRMAEVKKVPIQPFEQKEKSGIHIDHLPGHYKKLAASTTLIVDDSKAAVFVIKSTLEDAGLKVVGEAYNAAEALDMTQRLKPSCITLDISMPGKEGTEIIPQLLQASPGVKIVMVSSSGYQDRVVESLQLGAVKFISKPYNPETLKKVVIDAITSQ